MATTKPFAIRAYSNIEPLRRSYLRTDALPKKSAFLFSLSA